MDYLYNNWKASISSLAFAFYKTKKYLIYCEKMFRQFYFLTYPIAGWNISFLSTEYYSAMIALDMNLELFRFHEGGSKKLNACSSSISRMVF
jgi:hypothetical protein